MERMAERCNQMYISARPQHTADFAHHQFGSAHMLQNGIAFHALKNSGREGKVSGICSDIHAGYREEIEVDVAIHATSGAADVEIPASQGEVLGFPWI